jgi:hypothetical protein
MSYPYAYNLSLELIVKIINYSTLLFYLTVFFIIRYTRCNNGIEWNAFYYLKFV